MNAQGQRGRPPHGERYWTLGFLVLGALLLAFVLTRPERPPDDLQAPQLQRVAARGLLRVATVNSPLTYYTVQDRTLGFEYDLARGFAEHLGVELEIVLAERFSDLFTLVESGRVDLAAASITVTEERKQRVRFGPSYKSVTQEVVYRSGSLRPRKPADLIGRRIAVVDGSSYAETLRELQSEHPGLKWKEQPAGDIESLFAAISARELELTIADSNILDLHQRFYPLLKRAFPLREAQPIAWAFPPGEDDSLIHAATIYFERLDDHGLLADIKQRYFAHARAYDKINTHYFLRHIRTRLPLLRPHFESAALENGFDWKLLAAVAYQESHWDPDAVSPTGVRGVMMLTRATAGQMGISDRRDPAQSVRGGARYLRRVKEKIPERIPEPDRTWMALAAYNVGFGHLEDARIITQRRGKDPDRWADVAESLPLLSDRKWYSTTRHGYARGREPVRYVRNIRSYYDILVWRLNRRSALASTEAAS